MLLEVGLIDQFQLDSALSMQRNLGGRLGSALVKLGYLPEKTIMEFLETQVRYARVSLDEIEISEEVMRLLPPELMLEMLVLPLEFINNGHEKTLRVAMTDPTNIEQLDLLQFKTGCRILAVLAAEGEIENAIKRHLAKIDAESEDTAPTEIEAPALNDLDSTDPRLERLLKLLQGKGVLSAIEVERIKFG
jgi:type IV pilus assembly protein PilB